jgi:hypothetical protein
MSQPQVITTLNPRQNTPFAFSLKIAGKEIPRPAETLAAAIFVHCDICAEHAHGTRDELTAGGWGIYPKSAFCPEHESMV